MPDVMGNLNKVLAGREFIEGDAFSISDVAVGAHLLYIPAFLPQVNAH
jgi:glutathione S-transferase